MVRSRGISSLSVLKDSLKTAAGSVSDEQMRTVADGRYDDFNARRRAAEAIEADRENVAALELADMNLLEKAEAGK